MRSRLLQPRLSSPRPIPAVAFSHAALQSSIARSACVCNGGAASTRVLTCQALVPPCAAHVSQGGHTACNDVCGPYAGSSSRESSTVAPDGPSLVRGFPGAVLVRRRGAKLTVRRACLSTPQPRCTGPGGHYRVVQAAVPRPRGGTQARQGTETSQGKGLRTPQPAHADSVSCLSRDQVHGAAGAAGSEDVDVEVCAWLCKAHKPCPVLLLF